MNKISGRYGLWAESSNLRKQRAKDSIVTSTMDIQLGEGTEEDVKAFVNEYENIHDFDAAHLKRLQFLFDRLKNFLDRDIKKLPVEIGKLNTLLAK